MSAAVPFIIIVMLVHLGIFITSTREDHVKRFMLAMGIAAVAIPLAWFGERAGAEEPGLLIPVLRNAPVYMPVVAFLAYLLPGSRP